MNLQNFYMSIAEMILSCLFFLFLIFFPIDFCYFDVKCHGWVFVLPMCCQIVLFTVHASRRLKKKKVQCLERSRVKSWKHFLMKKETSLQLTFFFLRRCPAQITHRVNNWHEKPLTRSYPFYRVTQMSAVNITYYSNPTSWFPRLATGLIPFSFPSLL